MFKNMRIFFPLVLGISCVLACGGGSETSVLESTPLIPVEKVEQPTEVPPPAPTATPKPGIEKIAKKEEPKTQKPAEKPSSSPSPAKEVKPTPAPPKPTPIPPTPTPIPPTPVPVQVAVIDDYGFSMDLDSESEVQSAGDSDQGTLSVQLEGAKAVLLWLPESNLTKEILMQFTYGQLTAAEPDLVFTPIAQDEISVDGQDGLFGGFVSATSTGQIIGGGLIGTWNCASSGTVFALTVVGQDATTLQIRFQRLTSNFSCSP